MEIEQRFIDLCQRLTIGETIATGAWSALYTCYTEPHRHYHNLRHIEAMLSKMDDVAPGDAAMELSIWYHDAIYDPKARDNEERSATFFGTEFGHHLDKDLSDRVVRMILATDYARPRSAAPDEDMIRDIDLSILASAPEDYRAYTLAVRMEYAHVPDADFRTGRRAVMERFLEGSIYHTAVFAAEESKAKENILVELDSLAE
ncbi:MAG: phosphohydrolase [Verrucomicrobiota bacterium]